MTAPDQQSLGHFDLTWNPERVGSYNLDMPAALAGRFLARLSFVAETLKPAGEAASLYTGLAPHQMVAFRLWYVRLQPL